MISRSLAAAIVLTAAPLALGDDGVTIGRHSGEGGVERLHAHCDLPQPVALPPSIFPGFPGFITGLFGFSNTPIDHDDEDLFTLAPEADIFAEVVSIGGGLVVRDGPHALSAGEAMHLGPPFFDYHPLMWLPGGGSGSVTFVFRDAGGVYTPSEELTIAFTAADPACPADLGAQGGQPGADGVLDNNDFVAFIDAFFGAEERADLGSQGGVAGSDLTFDNNDFVVFIDAFFGGC